MAKYDYECKECKNQFELEHSMKEISDKECPICKGISIRVYTKIPVHFKGYGWTNGGSKCR